MCCCKIGMIVLSVFMSARWPVAGVFQPWDLHECSEVKAQLGATRNQKDLAARLALLLPKCRVHYLDKLVCDPDTTLALAAGWERVRRTIPESTDDEIGPDVVALARFIGLVEGRLQTVVPSSWSAALRSAKAFGRQRIYFPPDTLQMMAFRRYEREVKCEGSNWSVVNGSDTFTVPADKSLIPPTKAVVQTVDGTAYVAMFSQMTSTYRISAIRRDNRQVIWSSKVWAEERVHDREVNVGGAGWHAVKLLASNNTLAVFGISGWTMYFEVIDRKTGESCCRFSTANFDYMALHPR
jgi:hypothetical protein